MTDFPPPPPLPVPGSDSGATYGSATFVYDVKDIGPEKVNIQGAVKRFFDNYANFRGREGWAFLYSAITTAFVVITLFLALYPNVMPSSNGVDSSLNIFNASSTHYTLKVMTVVAVFLTPFVLLYQGWTYWTFRKRINPSQIANPETGVLDTIHP